MKDFLLTSTVVIDFGATSITLWLTFYIFGKGFPNKIALLATADLESSADELVMAIASNPDSEFVKLVEDGLCH